MSQKEKQLLLVDICCRLPYGVICRIKSSFAYEDGRVRHITEDKILDPKVLSYIQDLYASRELDECKPYLRPMSSMTEDELKEFVNLKLARIERYRRDLVIKETEYILGCWYVQIAYKDNSGEEYVTNLYVGRCSSIEEIDFLNANHFDYRGLIPKGLALEAKEGMYNTKQ